MEGIKATEANALHRSVFSAEAVASFSLVSRDRCREAIEKRKKI